ncbi:hypothetical protein EVAR_55685_1 [Eumeta japonica]|uniref:Uncharacterized protein n=1 Tax=Eumeta variegata TaxID=151549 RepID=A0A4C1ZEW4_EUMVA|nr:hypothetical protein EVAR_55685_1 [Eumeta japonica]
MTLSYNSSVLALQLQKSCPTRIPTLQIHVIGAVPFSLIEKRIGIEIRIGKSTMRIASDSEVEAGAQSRTGTKNENESGFGAESEIGF